MIFFNTEDKNKSKTVETANSILDARIKRESGKKQIKGLIIKLGIVAAATFVALGLIFGIAVTKGSSMSPAYKDGDVVLFLRIFSEPKQGDVVLADIGEDEYIKRIIGLPGQTVDIDEKSGKVVINGEVLNEPYIYLKTMPKKDVKFPITLKEDEYFVLGDNRTNSLDSRNYGPIKKDAISGKIIFVFRAQK